MQLNFTSKRLFTIILAFTLIALNLSMKLNKHTTIASETNERRKNKESQLPVAPAAPAAPIAPAAAAAPIAPIAPAAPAAPASPAVSANTIMVSNPLKATVKTAAPYTNDNALECVREIGQVILPADEQTQTVLLGCLQIIGEKYSNFSSALIQFWNKMSDIASKKAQWQNSSYQDVLNTLANRQAIYKNQSKSCADLKIPASVDVAKVLDKLNQGKYFGGFNDVKPSNFFITGMISNHRDTLDSNTFTNINKVSRGEQIKILEAQGSAAPQAVPPTATATATAPAATGKTARK